MVSPERVVICGAGVIGAAIAQALARRGTPVTLIDRVGVAAAASGKAGGFLALDWNDGSPLGPLARRSFALHTELSESLSAGYGYRSVETLMSVASDPTLGETVRVADNPEWLDGNVAVHRVIGTHETTAQVHPRRFTEALVADATAHGATVVVGEITQIDPGDGDAERGVVVDGERVTADTIVVALGPWTARVGLPIPEVRALKGASITLAAEVPAQAVFSEFVTAGHERLSPEIYPRGDGEVYVCGVPSDDPLPSSPEEVMPDEGHCALLRAMAAEHSSALKRATVVAEQACFRPVIADGLPLIGPVPGVDGLIVATGHGPWGILNAPATGEMVAEMILDGGAHTLDAAAFDPGRSIPGG